MLAAPNEKSDFEEHERLGLYLGYCRSKRILLQTLMTDTKKRLQRSEYDACAKVSGQICRTHRRLHRLVAQPFSLLDLHSVFVAGFTMVYCVWVDPTLYDADLAADFGACSTVLYAIAEGWASAKKYRDAFEAVAEITEVFASSYTTRQARIEQLNDVQHERPVLPFDGERIAKVDDYNSSNSDSREAIPSCGGGGNGLPTPWSGDWNQETLIRDGLDVPLDVWQAMNDFECAQALDSTYQTMDFPGIEGLLADEGLGWFSGSTGGIDRTGQQQWDAAAK